jgi:geranylgeranyl transferase type-2 subunit beta
MKLILSGGFGGNADHDSHLLYTTSAIQCLIMCDALDKVDVDKVANCM